MDTIEKKAWEYNPVNTLDNEMVRSAYIKGYNQALEDNKKKYTEEQLKEACHLYGMGRGMDSIIESLENK